MYVMSEVTGKRYATVSECLAAENEAKIAKAEAEKKAKAEEEAKAKKMAEKDKEWKHVQDLFTKAEAADNEAAKAWEAFVNKYGVQNRYNLKDLVDFLVDSIF